MMPINTMDSEAVWKTVQILIRWLHQKPSDLDLHCFLKRINPGSAEQGLGCVLIQNRFKSKLIWFEGFLLMGTNYLSFNWELDWEPLMGNRKDNV